MTKANPPPRTCVIELLIAVDGENWARWALLQYPDLLWHVRSQAEDCDHCVGVLGRLFPEGFPETTDQEDDDHPELEQVLEQLRKDTGKSIDDTSA